MVVPVPTATAASIVEGALQAIGCQSVETDRFNGLIGGGVMRKLTVLMVQVQLVSAGNSTRLHIHYSAQTVTGRSVPNKGALNDIRRDFPRIIQSMVEKASRGPVW